MEWVTLFLALLGLFGSVFAVIAAERSAKASEATSADLVSLHGQLSALEASERLTPSRLVELQMLNESVEHARQLLIKAAARGNAQRAASAATAEPPLDKAALRREMMAGRLKHR